MKHERTESHCLFFVPAAKSWNRAWSLAALLAAGALSLSGCGGSSSSQKITPPATGSPVIVGTTKNSLPAIPAQSQSNKYIGIDVIQGPNWNWDVSQKNATYNYQEQQGVGGSTSISGGAISSFGDFEYFTDTTAAQSGFFGLNAEVPGGVSLFVPAPFAFPQAAVVVGVTQARIGCLAPDGKVAFNFILAGSPQGPTYNPQTDAVIGSATLGFADGKFSFSGVTQTGVGGSAASTGTIPFADSYCIQALAGYGIQSTSASDPTLGTETVLTYIGDTGALVGSLSYDNPTTSLQSSLGWAGFVQPGSPIDLSSVTSGTYKGYNYNRSFGYPDPAYFGATSQWITTPVLTQGSGQLLGGYEDFVSSVSFSTSATQVTGNVLIDFGTQDSSHPGSFPSAKFTEQDPSNLCLPAQQSVGSDGLTYCTFPVAALIGQSYGKNIIFIAGPDPTAQAGLFYALVQE